MTGATDAAVRLGAAGDLEALCSLDHLAREGLAGRREEIAGAIGEGRLLVAEVAGDPCAYAALAPWFFGARCVALLYVAAPHRRSGIGRRLLDELARLGSGKVFTSTNASNVPMRRLLEGAGWQPCGELRGLDDGDPELFYLLTR